MRTIAKAKATFDAMCERVLSRRTKGERLADKQMCRKKIADSWVEIEQFRLLVLRTAWLIDKHQDYKRVLKDIAAVKAAMPKVLHDVAGRTLQLPTDRSGSRKKMPFAQQLLDSYMLGLADARPRFTRLPSPSRCCADTSRPTRCSRATRYNRRASVRLSYMGQAWRDRGLFGVTHERGPLAGSRRSRQAARLDG